MVTMLCGGSGNSANNIHERLQLSGLPILYLSIQIELLILLVASGMRAYVHAFEWRFWEFC